MIDLRSNFIFDVARSVSVGDALRRTNHLAAARRRPRVLPPGGGGPSRVQLAVVADGARRAVRRRPLDQRDGARPVEARPLPAPPATPPAPAAPPSHREPLLRQLRHPVRRAAVRDLRRPSAGGYDRAELRQPADSRRSPESVAHRHILHQRAAAAATSDVRSPGGAACPVSPVMFRQVSYSAWQICISTLFGCFD